MKAKSHRDAYNLSHNLKSPMIGNTMLSTIEPILIVEVIPSTVALCRPPNNQMTTTQPTLDE